MFTVLNTLPSRPGIRWFTSPWA